MYALCEWRPAENVRAEEVAGTIESVMLLLLLSS